MTGRPAEALLLLAALCAVGCGPSESAVRPVSGLVFEEQPRSATGVQAREPRMVVRASGMIALAQVHTEGAFEHDLVVYRSESGGDVFGEPVAVDPGGGRVVAHGEGAPAFLQGARSQFHAVWIANRPGGGRVLQTARSKDFLHSFDEPVVITTGSRGEPAFFDAAVLPSGQVAASWLARAKPGSSLPGTSRLLVSVAQGPGGAFGEPVVVANDVCPCCRPALLSGEDGQLYLAWRTTDAEDVRSMVVASSTDQGRTWSAPAPIPGVGWKIKGCPHSGPSMAFHEGRLHVAWYSEGEGSPRLYWSRQDDQGGFTPARVLSAGVRDANHPFLGQVDGRLFAAFQARDSSAAGGWPTTGIFVTEIADDEVLAPVEVPTGDGTASYPRLNALGAGRLLVAWTEHGEGDRQVMLARARLEPAAH